MTRFSSLNIAPASGIAGSSLSPNKKGPNKKGPNKTRSAKTNLARIPFFAFLLLFALFFTFAKPAFSASVLNLFPNLTSSSIPNILPTSLTQVSASANYMFLKHENYNSLGYTTNTEKGWLSGAQFSILNRKKYLYGRVSLEMYGGNVNFTQELSSGMFNSTTDEKLTRFSYRLDYSKPRQFAQFYAKATFNNWSRKTRTKDLISVPSRQYKWWRTEIGTQLEIYDSPRNTIKADFAISQDFFSEMLLDLTQENLGKPLLKLKNKMGASIRFILKHRFSKNHSGELFAKTDYWQFGDSNTQTISNGAQTIVIKENESQSLTSSIGATYVYDF